MSCHSDLVRAIVICLGILPCCNNGGGGGPADVSPPSVPTGLSAVATSSIRVDLQWDPSADVGGGTVAGYTVFRDGLSIATVTGTTYADTTVSSSTPYRYAVAAYDTFGNRSVPCGEVQVTTPPDTEAPSIPTGLTATASAPQQVDLAWSPSSDTGGSGVAQYIIYRGGAAIVSVSGTAYSDPGVLPGTAYTYTVSARDHAGNESAQSAPANVTTPPLPDTTAPSVPELVGTGRLGAVYLAWSSSTDTGGSGLAGYRLYRGGLLIATTSSTRYTDSSVAATTTYAYRVSAYDNAGNESALSRTATVLTATPALCLDPPLILLSVKQGETIPAANNASLTYGGAGTASWYTSADRPWLHVLPASGSTSTETDTLSAQATVTRAEAWLGPTSLVNVPTTRNGHLAVWTGLEMLVPWGWGVGTPNDLYHYSPSTDTWSGPTTSLGSCPERWRATAVWTGKEVIVWGGLEGASNVNTGYRYSPSNNTWSWISSTGAPSARRGHTAVWTGKEMIVWGGGSGGITNTGGRYDPATNTWGTPPTTVGAPVARGGHVAVWTGHEMIIWGASEYNDGARYDPTANAWVGMISTVGAPAVRNFFCAVWTGDEMIVWGGHDGTNYVNTGGRYHPGTDTWRGATPTASAPTARDGVSGAWSGREMVLWAGHNGSTPLNTGARYQPPIALAPGFYAGTVRVEETVGAVSPGTSIVSLEITP